MRRLFTIAAVVMCCTLSGNAQTDNGNRLPRGRFMTAKMPCSLLSGVNEREYGIYLPGSYDKDSLRTYPVLYLMHGGGGAHTDWERQNHLSLVADRLAGSGATGEMIVVCPEGNQNNMMYFNAAKDGDGTPDWRYEDYFFNELVPFIERSYRTRTDKGGRAIAGFSMGGGAATVYGVHHPEKFSMVYDVSGYLRAQQMEFLKGDPSAPWRQRVIDRNNPITRIVSGNDAERKAWRQVDWKIAVGDRDFTLEANMDLMKAMRQRGIGCAMHVDDGTHDAHWVNSVLEDVLKRADRNFQGTWIDNGSRHIYGVLSKPQYTGKKQPLAIVSHGFNGSHQHGRSYFKTLNDMGYQVFTLDFPCGSLNSRSDNNTVNMSVLDEVSDLKAVIAHFRSQPDVDPAGIVLIGESQGGLVTALTSADMPTDVKAAVLVFPALCIASDWNKRYATEQAIPDTTKVWGVPVGRRYFLEARKIDVFKKIGKFKRPVLIVQGDKDHVVSMDDSRRAVKTYKNARLHVIPGAGHGFKPAERQESLQQISQFLESLR